MNELGLKCNPRNWRPSFLETVWSYEELRYFKQTIVVLGMYRILMKNKCVSFLKKRNKESKPLCEWVFISHAHLWVVKKILISRWRIRDNTWQWGFDYSRSPFHFLFFVENCKLLRHCTLGINKNLAPHIFILHITITWLIHFQFISDRQQTVCWRLFCVVALHIFPECKRPIVIPRQLWCLVIINL